MVVSVRTAVRVAVEAAAMARVQVIACPDCGARAEGDWRAIDALFYTYRRQFDVVEGLAYPHVYRCRSCGYVFGEPYPACIDYPLDKPTD